MIAAESAFDLGRVDRADELLRKAETGEVPESSRWLEAQVSRLRGRMATAAGDHEEADRRFMAAEALLREIEDPFWNAVTELQHAEILAASGRATEAEALLASARAAFAQLRAQPWLERIDGLLPASAAAGVAPA